MVDIVTTLQTLNEHLRHLTSRYDCKVMHELKTWLNQTNINDQIMAHLEKIGQVSDESKMVVTIHYRDNVRPRYDEVQYEVKGSDTIANLRDALANRYTVLPHNLKFTAPGGDGDSLDDKDKLACCAHFQGLHVKHLNPDVTHVIRTSTGRYIHVTTPPGITVGQLKTYILAQEHIALDRQHYVDVSGVRYDDNQPIVKDLVLHVKAPLTKI